MKILVKNKGGPNIRIWLPTRLIFSKAACRLCRKMIQKGKREVPFSVSVEDGARAAAALRRMKKNHPGVPLVEVETSGGDYIWISL